jgi:hypothetical protein
MTEKELNRLAFKETIKEDLIPLLKKIGLWVAVFLTCLSLIAGLSFGVFLLIGPLGAIFFFCGLGAATILGLSALYTKFEDRKERMARQNPKKSSLHNLM